MYAFRCHLNAFHGTVLVIIQTIDADGTAETASGCIDASIMINEIPVALELDNSLMIGIGIAGYLIKDAFVFPRSGNAMKGNTSLHTYVSTELPYIGADEPVR